RRSAPIRAGAPQAQPHAFVVREAMAVSDSAPYLSLNAAEIDEPSAVLTMTSQHVPGSFGESHLPMNWPAPASYLRVKPGPAGTAAGEPIGADVSQLKRCCSIDAIASSVVSSIEPATTLNLSGTGAPPFCEFMLPMSTGLSKPTIVHGPT